MSILYYFRNSLLILGLILVVVPGCRKKIDFDESPSTSTTGPIDPSQPILSEWQELGPGLWGVQNIESDGQRVYFNKFANGVNRMHTVDTSGNVNLLFDISTSNDVTLIHFGEQSQILYYCRSLSTTSLSVTEFDISGPGQSYSLGTAQVAGGQINSMIDFGNELFVAGSFHLVSNAVYSNSACFIDKTTGDSIPMDGLTDHVKDAVLFNNEIYVAGEELAFTAGSGNSYSEIAKWDGSQWLSVSPYVPGNSSITGLGTSNGELIVGGSFIEENASLYKYNQSNNSYSTYPEFVMASGSSSVKIKNYDGKLYAAGTFKLGNASFRSIYELDNGTWRSIGALDNTATDFAVCQGYIYAVAGEKIFRYKL